MHNIPTILTQTDTTVGFLSTCSDKLYEIKVRPASKPFIKVFNNFKALSTCSIRVPHSKKNMVRRAKKTTFIVKNQAFRVATCRASSQLLRNQKWHYSTSANESGKSFSREFCESVSDVAIEDSRGFSEDRSSSLFIISDSTQKRLR